MVNVGAMAAAAAASAFFSDSDNPLAKGISQAANMAANAQMYNGVQEAMKRRRENYSSPAKQRQEKELGKAHNDIL